MARSRFSACSRVATRVRKQEFEHRRLRLPTVGIQAIQCVRGRQDPVSQRIRQFAQLPAAHFFLEFVARGTEQRQADGHSHRHSSRVPSRSRSHLRRITSRP